LAFLSKIIIFDSKQLKYSPKVYIFALRRENGNSRRNEPPIFGQRRQIAHLFSGIKYHNLVPRLFPSRLGNFREEPGNKVENIIQERLKFLFKYVQLVKVLRNLLF
jgi:hypothetical protein